MEQNIGQITYINFEAVPQKIDIDDFFEEVTLFRKHLCTIQINRESFLYDTNTHTRTERESERERMALSIQFMSI
jgi:hypothetical protein